MPRASAPARRPGASCGGGGGAGPGPARLGREARRAPDGDIDHPARIYLLDGASRVREIYSLDFFDERPAWLDVQALLRER
jgi:hypothetical protein